MTEAFPVLGISCLLPPLLIPFGFVGRGEESGPGQQLGGHRETLDNVPVF